MTVERTATAAIVALVLASLLVAAVVPGATSEPRDTVPPGHVQITDVSFATDAVSGETATLNVTTYLSHRGGVTGNVTVAVRAVDLDTGLVATTTARDLDEVTGDREVPVPATVTVERQGGYRIEIAVYRDGRRVETARREVRGVGSLMPSYARSSVSFHRFDRRASDGELPSVQYSVAAAEGDSASLQVSAYVTNRGGDTGDLSVEFVLRQAESNIVAARASTAVGDVRPGRTVTPGVSVTVPDGYNYYIDAILSKDGVIVDTARGAANLDPSNTIEVDESDDEGGLNVSDFAGGGPPQSSGGTPSPMHTDTPGLGLVTAIAALALAGLLARRYT